MVQKTEVVQVFARTPIIGEVKTRLIPILGPKGAYELHKNMTARLISSLSSLQTDIQIWTDISAENRFLKEFGLSVINQVGEELGEKMSNAIIQGLATHEKVALIGTDLPELDSIYLANAFEKLERFDIVIGPTLDGGFGLIAVQRFNRSIFDGLVWGGPHVFSGLIGNIEKSNLDYCLAPLLWDVDGPADFARYEKWLSKS
ncbi:TIGR04282 family arsenosugar biosynthesis glycosyltransferase [Gammaproteobacteria bacterium]|nr:TIGR04282 family arsenosugar biosynthesis glycosyltransferase [Gammaproteobacteria bacterium]